jgi:DNA-binding MarR family transcriptional regulator
MTGSLIWRVTMKWRAAVERAVAPLGLTHAQYTLLGWLSRLSRRGERPSQRELADFTGLEPVYVSKLVRALEASGFVERTTHPADPRAVQLGLTASGAEVIGRAAGIVHGLLDELTAPIGGLAGRRNRELIDTLRALLGAPQPEGGEDMTQPTTTLFGQDLGVAAQAGRRVLDTVLRRDELGYAEWIAIKLVNDSGAAIPRDTLVARLATGANLDATEALSGLESRGVFTETPSGIALTAAGQALFDRLFGEVRKVSVQLLAGLPEEDVATTRRVLAGYIERATAFTG